MHTNGTIKWHSVFREVAVIVAGVLCALAGQAWWQNRQDSKREHDYIRELLADTHENDMRLADAISADSSTQWILGHLTTAVYTRESGIPLDSVVGWLRGGALAASEFQPISGTYGALLASGDLRLIRTDSLRARLVAYSAMLQTEDEMLRFFLAQEFSNPGQIARTLPSISQAIFGESRSTAVDQARADGFSVRGLRNSPDFTALLFALRIANSSRLSHLRHMRDETQRLQRALLADLPDSATPLSN